MTMNMTWDSNAGMAVMESEVMDSTVHHSMTGGTFQFSTRRSPAAIPPYLSPLLNDSFRAPLRKQNSLSSRVTQGFHLDTFDDNI
ncbi:MAG: hypothetical protein DRQ65_00870 [Gammaproteobacteria bacterium]|nr:MAG: hypothetical protein DRQ65_00870 [Gammaproteobacteria bacterium]